MLSLLLLLIQWPFQKLIFVLVHCSEEVRTLALKYFYIRIWAAPATLCLMTFRGWFIGMQDSFSSMLTDVTVNGVNIIASILLALGIKGTAFHGLGFVGIAWGTVAAQYAGLLIAATILFLKYRWGLRHAVAPGSTLASSTTATLGTLRGGTGAEHSEAIGGAERSEAVERSRVLPGTDKKNTTVREFFTVNRDLFIRSLCLMAVYLGFTAISARFGDTPLAMCSIMMKLMMIFSYFTDGFAFAGEALTGRFFGMKDKPAVSATVKWTFIWSMGIGLLFIGIYSIAGIPMFRIMTSDVKVIEASRAFIPWLALIPLLGCPAFTWDGIYIGATATKVMRDSNIGCLIAFFAVWFLGWLFLKPAGDGKVHLLFAAYYAHLLFRSLYQTIQYRTAILDKI